jgi:glycosyltransferase involved in cell wall biosynthesis
VTLDLSVIVTTHGEGLDLHATLRNVLVGVAQAEARGISTEVVVVVDRPTSATAHYLRDAGAQLLSDIRHVVLPVNNGDPGLSRMSGVNASSGKYIALVDGDNLFNETWLAAAVEFLRKKPENYVAHPAFVVTFGSRANVRITQGMDSPRFGYGDLLNENPWDTAAVMERALLLAHPYRAFPLAEQLGPEDWVWNIDTVLVGVRHVPVPETVMFYRAKTVASSVNERRQAEGALLPPSDIVALAELLGPGIQSPLTRRNQGSRRFLSRVYQALRPARRFVIRVMPGVAHALYLFARRIYVLLTGITVDELVTSAFRLTRHDVAFLARERVTLAHFEASLLYLPPIALLPIWRVGHPDYAELLVKTVSDIGSGVTHIVAVPRLSIGGATLIANSYAQGFSEIVGDPQRVVVLSERGAVRRNPGLDAGVRVMSWDESVYDLPEVLRVRLLAEVLVQCQPQRVHIVNAPLTYAALKSFGRALVGPMIFTAEAFCVDRTDEGIPAAYLLWQARDYLPGLRAVYCDNQQVATDLQHLAGYPRELFSVHYQPRLVGQQLSVDSGKNDSTTISVDKEGSGVALRVLWAARLDRQKNVDTLIDISQEIARRDLPIEIHVYGSLVLDSRSAKLKNELGRSAIYHGEFEGGLATISRDSDVFLMTSLWEGMPLTLLEATDLGLPIVAPHVGGIAEFVENEISGLIVHDPQDVDSYIEALLRLRDDVQLRSKLVAGARARAASQHTWAGFVATLANSEHRLSVPVRPSRRQM